MINAYRFIVETFIGNRQTEIPGYEYENYMHNNAMKGFVTLGNAVWAL
jgi:hypothetical protein